MIARGCKKCKQCKVAFTDEERARNHRIHSHCIAAFLNAQADKKMKARLKREKAEDKVRRENLKTRSEWHADAQKAANAYVRARDVGQPCISCGKPWEASHQAGHYRSRGAAKNLALDPRNIFGQCIQCNLHKHSNAIEYRIRLVQRCGVEHVEALESDNAPRHYSVDDLIAIRHEFLMKTKQLKEVEA